MMIDSAAILVGIRLAISEYPIIGHMLVPDTRHNRLEIAKQHLAEKSIDGIVDCVSDPAAIFCRVMKYVLDVKLHLSYKGMSHHIAGNGPIEIWHGGSGPVPECRVQTTCGRMINANIGKEYQVIDIEDLISNTWCSQCWPKDFLEDLHEWQNTRHT